MDNQGPRRSHLSVDMAPHFAHSQLILLRDLIRLTTFTNEKIAIITNCSRRSVTKMRANPRIFGQTQSPKNTSGRRSCLVPHVLTALLDRLLFKPDMCLDEMSEYHWNRYGLHASEASLRRCLKACAWTRKKNRRIAQERESDLRDTYLHELSQYKFNQLVFVDESGCDTGTGIRRTGWSQQLPCLSAAQSRID